MLHANVQAYYSYGTGGAEPLLALIESVGAAVAGARYPASRVVMVTRNLDVAAGADADAVLGTAAAVGLPTYRTFDEAATAIAAGKEFARARSERWEPGIPGSPERPGAAGAKSGKRSNDD
jgi:hypothetical protein